MQGLPPKWSTLQNAIRTGNYHTAKKLIKTVAPDTSQLNYVAETLGGEETLLHTAVSNNKLEMVKLLLRFDINLDLGNKIGQTALMRASALGYYDIVEVLIGAGANTHLTDRKGATFEELTLDRSLLKHAIARGMKRKQKTEGKQKEAEDDDTKEKDKAQTKSSDHPTAILARCGIKREILIETIKELNGLGFKKPDILSALVAVTQEMKKDKEKEKELTAKLVQGVIEYLFAKAEGREPSSGSKKNKVEISSSSSQSPEKLERDLFRLKKMYEEERLQQLNSDNKELEALKEMTYLWCLRAVVADRLITQNKLAILNKIPYRQTITTEQNIRHLKQVGLENEEEFQWLQTQSTHLDQKILRIESSMEDQLTEQTKDGGNKGSIERQLLIELSGNECTVCLDHSCDQVFLDCMHSCVCSNCAHLFQPKNESKDDQFGSIGLGRGRFGRGGFGRGGRGQGAFARLRYDIEEDDDVPSTSLGSTSDEPPKCPRCRADIREVRPIHK